MKAFKAVVIRLNHDLIALSVDCGKGNWPLIEVVDELHVQVLHLHVVARIGWHGDHQSTLSESVLDWILDLKGDQFNLRLQIELEAELLGILDVVLLVVA